MTRAERELQDKKITGLYKNGLSFNEIGDSIGHSSDYVRQRLTKLGVHKPKRIRSSEELNQLIPVAQSLYSDGKTTNEIVAILHVNTSWVSQVIDTSVKPWKEKRYADMRAFKAQGHTMADVANKFDVSEMTAQRVCKGIAPQASAYKGRPNPNKGKLQDENSVALFIESKMPGVEYVGNYTGCDGRADIRCKSCGTIFNRSMISIRKGQCSCPKCRAEREKELKRERAKKDAVSNLCKALKTVARQRARDQREAEINRKREARKHRCPVCGTVTYRNKYCSDACARKVANAAGEIRRRNLLKSAIVDKDISLEGLFRRDKGVCSLCGKRCDYEDYTVTRGVFIAGDWYPSIDHIIPLAKGGLHSWDNVQLAHRRCNWEKSDRI